MWGEALALHEAGAVWWGERNTALEALCVAEQTEREKVHPWTEKIEPWLANQIERADVLHHTPRPANVACPCLDCAGVTVGAILAGAMALDPGKWTTGDAAAVAGILRALGWAKPTRDQRRQEGTRVRPFWPAGHAQLVDRQADPEAGGCHTVTD